MNTQKIKSYRGIRPGDSDGRKGLRNPERGFRFEIGIGITESDPVQFSHIRNLWPFPQYENDGVAITQAYCYLTQYYNKPIAESKLAALQTDFDRARHDGVKFLLRFAYEFNEKTPGPTCEQILAHIDQLKELLDKNWDIIYNLQVGFVGLWGEFHTSVEGIEKDISQTAAILQKTLEILPPNRTTMMRRGQYKINNLKELNEFCEITPEIAFSQLPAAKIGFFNDGTLANYWDGGTFFEPPFYASQGNEEFDYIVREAPYMPVDGELFWSGQTSEPLDSNGIKAIERFRLHHYSTFSLVHSFSELDTHTHLWTIDYWKQMELLPKHLDLRSYPYSPDYFYNNTPRSAFEYIRDHLGYRLELVELRYQKDNGSGVLSLEADIINRGFSTLINPREVYFVLVNQAENKFIEIPCNFDCRKFQPYLPGDKSYIPLRHTVSAEYHFDTPLSGKWELALWLPDEMPTLHKRSDYAIRLATHLNWREIDGYGLNMLGVTIN